MDILKDPCIWIADTGATNHSTFSKIGSKNEVASSTQALGLSGKAVAAQKDIDLPGVLCDKYGNEKLPVNLTEVGFVE